ncbi:MAG: hypothetical protein II956_02180 [Bacteroidales bacterium]|nr:hypothetical protein [Bacteroidales bacterium]
MKTIIFILILAFMTLNAGAQITDTSTTVENSTPEDTIAVTENDTVILHLKYEDIEIDGVLTDYMHKLNKLGYKNVGIEKGVGILTANIMGCKNAIVNVASSHANTKVYAVSVCYCFAQKEEELEERYNNIIKNLTETFGEPVAENDGSFSEFIYPGYESGWRNVKLIKNCMFKNEYGLAKIAVFQRNLYTLNIIYADHVNYEDALKERQHNKQGGK